MRSHFETFCRAVGMARAGILIIPEIGPQVTYTAGTPLGAHIPYGNARTAVCFAEKWKSLSRWLKLREPATPSIRVKRAAWPGGEIKRRIVTNISRPERHGGKVQTLIDSIESWQHSGLMQSFKRLQRSN